MRLENEFIETLSIETAAGCMGESRCFKAMIEKSGAFTFHGIRNVDHLGDHVGCVNHFCLDHLLTVINSIGVDRALRNRETDVLAITGGDWRITVRTATDTREFVCNAGTMSATFWCSWRLIELLLANAEWGQAAYDAASRKSDDSTHSMTDRRIVIPPLGTDAGEQYF